MESTQTIGYLFQNAIHKMNFSTNFPTVVANSSSLTFFDISMGSSYIIGLSRETGLRTILKNSLNTSLSNFFISLNSSYYRIYPDVFLFDSTLEIGFVHSYRVSQSGDYWNGIGGALLPVQTTGGVISQNANGIELIFTGDELIKKVLLRSDNTYLVGFFLSTILNFKFLSEKGYIYTFAASTITSCSGTYCR